jgi:hypothetical protein
VASVDARVRVTDTDKGWRAFKETLRAFAAEDPYIVVGVMGTKAEATKRVRRARGRGRRRTSATNTTTLLDVARANEFGLGVPERSFLRSTFDDHRGAYRQLLAAGLRREILAIARRGASPINPRDAVTLKRVAVKAEGDVKRAIAAGIPPPNHPLTVARKGSSKPLIDTGQLRTSITSAIRSRSSK